MTTALWNINPKVGVGPITLGSPIQELKELKGFRAVMDPKHDQHPWFINDSLDISVYPNDNGLVESVSLDGQAILFGRDLIGLSFDEVVEIVGHKETDWDEPFESHNGSTYEIANFDPIGLSIWFHNGVSVTVILDDGDYED
jgi:hypothetical protein